MKYYFWDWNESLEIQAMNIPDREFPFTSKDEAKEQSCYTKLSEAKEGAVEDLVYRIFDLAFEIKELQKALVKVRELDAKSVTSVDSIRGIN